MSEKEEKKRCFECKKKVDIYSDNIHEGGCSNCENCFCEKHCGVSTLRAKYCSEKCYEEHNINIRGY